MLFRRVQRIRLLYKRIFVMQYELYNTYKYIMYRNILLPRHSRVGSIPRKQHGRKPREYIQCVVVHNTQRYVIHAHYTYYHIYLPSYYRFERRHTWEDGGDSAGTVVVVGVRYTHVTFVCFIPIPRAVYLKVTVCSFYACVVRNTNSRACTVAQSMRTYII